MASSPGIDYQHMMQCIDTSCAYCHGRTQQPVSATLAEALANLASRVNTDAPMRFRYPTEEARREARRASWRESKRRARAAA